MDTNKIREAVELLQSVDVLNASRVSERIDEVAAIIYSELDAPSAGLTVEDVMEALRPFPSELMERQVRARLTAAINAKQNP